jgi:hypothetical protein
MRRNVCIKERIKSMQEEEETSRVDGAEIAQDKGH